MNEQNRTSEDTNSTGNTSGIDFSRRNFLKATVTALGSVAIVGLAGCGSTPGEAAPVASSTPTGLPETWDYEADVIVVGYGGSGVTAALEALLQGASVIAIEKSPYNTGGNFGCSGGTIHDCADADLNEWMRIYQHGTFQTGATPDEIRPVLQEAIDSPKWIEEYGIEIRWKELTGDSHTYPSHQLEGNVMGRDGVVGIDLFLALDEKAQDAGVDLRLGTPGKRLIQNALTKEVVGVLAEGPDGQEITFKANKGVVLATGGYEFNMQMFFNYNWPGITSVAGGTPYNTGDGHAMALAVGADLWHMQEFHTGGLELIQPSIVAQNSIGAPDKKAEGGWCIVDCNAKRYMDESYVRAHDSNHKAAWDYSTPSAFRKDDYLAGDPEVKKYTTLTSDYVHLPMFQVFDSVIYDKTVLVELADATGTKGYDSVWAKIVEPKVGKPMNDFGPYTNEQAIEKGWIFKGETLEELAANIKGKRPCLSDEDAINGLDPAVFAESIHTYNSYVDARDDKDFHRDPTSMLGKIETGPFYAVELQWGIDFTEGGPRRNGKCQTINSFGEPIPRLYTTGELGSYNSWAYTFGGVLQAMTTGRIAGREAAGLAPWEA
jgi:succinate dehydrogenase/fumarate reductase flavoprotein subunit